MVWYCIISVLWVFQPFSQKQLPTAGNEVHDTIDTEPIRQQGAVDLKKQNIDLKDATKLQGAEDDSRAI